MTTTDDTKGTASPPPADSGKGDTFWGPRDLGPETVFLGKFTDTTVIGLPVNYDLYWAVEASGPTVVAVFGPDPADYGSGLEIAWTGRSPELLEARRRAAKLGLDVSRGRRENGVPWLGDVVLYRGKEFLYRDVVYKFRGKPDEEPRVRLEGFDRNSHPNGLNIFEYGPLPEVKTVDGDDIPWASVNWGVPAAVSLGLLPT